jgi:predicted lactoylglutathione lyase
MNIGHNSRLVAIVDDDESVQRALQDLIESDGLSALCFGSAEQFLDSEARNKAACLRKAMIDHIYLPVSDLKRSSEFYKKMLEPLGIDMPYKFDQLHGFAINSNPGFWLKNGEVAKDLYVAFTAKSADAVRASYKAAIDAGATSNKEPSLRPEWRADYFAANIGDPDGYNIEIAYKPWLYK